MQPKKLSDLRQRQGGGSSVVSWGPIEGSFAIFRCLLFCLSAQFIDSPAGIILHQEPHRFEVVDRRVAVH